MEGLMNLLAVEENWKKFLEMHCNEHQLVIINTPLYSKIAEGFTLPLMHKLLSTAVDVDEDYPASSRIRSGRLIEDMILSNRLDAAYPTINKENTLAYFRESALELMLVAHGGGGADHLVAGKELTKRLIRLSLQHNDEWGTLLQWFDLGLKHDEQRVLLKLFLEIFCEVDDDRFGLFVDNSDDLRYKFAAVLEPAVRENCHRFHTILVELLAEDQGFDNVAFTILRFFRHFFTHRNQQTALMNAAIMSLLFHPGTLAAAIYVRSSIDAGEFRFSSAMISRLIGIVLLFETLTRGGQLGKRGRRSYGYQKIGMVISDLCPK